LSNVAFSHAGLTTRYQTEDLYKNTVIKVSFLVIKTVYCKRSI